MKITSLCPELRESSIDVNRNGTWHLESLSALSPLEYLQHLEINVDLGIDQHIHESSHYLSRKQRKVADTEYRQPVFDAASETELFERLRGEKRGKELEMLTVTIGDWGRVFGGGQRITGWGEGFEKKWVCQVSDDGKEGCENGRRGVLWMYERLGGGINQCRIDRRGRGRLFSANISNDVPIDRYSHWPLTPQFKQRRIGNFQPSNNTSV